MLARVALCTQGVGCGLPPRMLSPVPPAPHLAPTPLFPRVLPLQSLFPPQGLLVTHQLNSAEDSALSYKYEGGPASFDSAAKPLPRHIEIRWAQGARAGLACGCGMCGSWLAGGAGTWVLPGGLSRSPAPPTQRQCFTVTPSPALPSPAPQRGQERPGSQERPRQGHCGALPARQAGGLLCHLAGPAGPARQRLACPAQGPPGAAQVWPPVCCTVCLTIGSVLWRMPLNGFILSGPRLPEASFPRPLLVQHPRAARVVRCQRGGAAAVGWAGGALAGLYAPCMCSQRAGQCLPC